MNLFALCKKRSREEQNQAQKNFAVGFFFTLPEWENM